MSATVDTTIHWKTTIIISSSLQNHETKRMLSVLQHRIRLSDTVGSGTFIFPVSGTAFLLVDPQDLSDPCDDSEFFEKIRMFVQVHRNSFLLLHVPFLEEKELKTLSVIQNRFFSTNLRILPVRNNKEIVKGMLTIAKATSKPHVDSIQERMTLAREHVIANSPVWEMLRGILQSSADIPP
ncbi:uncharacterized protein C1orf146 homolog [Thalassophryne amazonica]|uniref:uncharacterized protein C1orf146 homolog n=1 Tax=Thalassophryne amazonica TaxID=390379 RepID=UPI001471C9DE|nr:uncharacterized protein C1orf146 homolog [Thalassophryne amazonica]